MNFSFGDLSRGAKVASSHKKAAGRSAAHQSHPDEKPIFKGKGNPGNFEPASYGGGSRPGDNGVAHHLKVEQKQTEERMKGEYGFNQLASDEIPLNRSVPDTREEECRWWDYPTSMPTASVVLVFHNEGWSTLLRTVHSVLDRSPPEFLHEVVLVDDKSELDHLHDKLEREIEKPYYHGKVKLVHASFMLILSLEIFLNFFVMVLN